MKHPRLIDMQALSGTDQSECEYYDPVQYRGLTGKEYSKRKSRSKIARQSRKRNRK